ncbi:MAG TPA: nucleotidyl transferase AbiEii/AbiGii toxin family protein [Bryobacteraceae bacterium]|nr:nucleotidyl transferase AbiEii/AbiGii toxin family protein [Bryobacteraceae bacterium]
MQAIAFWKAVTMDQSNFLDAFLSLLRNSGIQFCVIGGQAVNAYVDPLVSLDLDVVVAVEQIAQVRKILEEQFHLEEFPHSLNVASPGSDLRVQIQTDPRYSDFVKRSTDREVLGLLLPVAALEDILQGKVWAASDPQRRASKRRKDLLDIERLLEANPSLKDRIPAEILERLTETL